MTRTQSLTGTEVMSKKKAPPPSGLSGRPEVRTFQLKNLNPAMYNPSKKHRFFGPKISFSFFRTYAPSGAVNAGASSGAGAITPRIDSPPVDYCRKVSMP
jgi:hypothetical protein